MSDSEREPGRVMVSTERSFVATRAGKASSPTVMKDSAYEIERRVASHLQRGMIAQIELGVHDRLIGLYAGDCSHSGATGL